MTTEAIFDNLLRTVLGDGADMNDQFITAAKTEATEELYSFLATYVIGGDKTDMRLESRAYFKGFNEAFEVSAELKGYNTAKREIRQALREKVRGFNYAKN